MKMKLPALLFVLLLWIAACSSSPGLGDFDADQWKNDPNGCKGLREKQLQKFKEVKDHLIGMSENRIIQLLGAPDKQFLQEKQKKTYKYYTEPGKQCADSLDRAKLVVIEFNSVRDAKLITITYN